MDPRPVDVTAIDTEIVARTVYTKTAVTSSLWVFGRLLWHGTVRRADPRFKIKLLKQTDQLYERAARATGIDQPTTL